VSAHSYDEEASGSAVTGLREEELGGKGGELYSAAYRHLRPGLGRWTSRDPAGDVDGPNLYRYAMNRPTVAVDPTGLAWEWSQVKPKLFETKAGRRALIRTGFAIPEKSTTKFLGDVSGFPENQAWESLELQLDVRLNPEEAAIVYIHESIHVEQLRELVFRLPLVLEQGPFAIPPAVRTANEIPAELATFPHIEELEKTAPGRLGDPQNGAPARLLSYELYQRSPGAWSAQIPNRWNYTEPFIIPCGTSLPLPVNRGRR